MHCVNCDVIIILEIMLLRNFTFQMKQLGPAFTLMGFFVGLLVFRCAGGDIECLRSQGEAFPSNRF